MLRYALLIACWLPLAANCQAPATTPKIQLSASGSGTSMGEGTVSVSGSIFLPPGWKLTLHVLTIRHSQGGTSTSLNAFLPVKGNTFSSQLSLKTGSYKIWAVIDVKDAEGRERQISSEPENVDLQ